MDPVIGAIITGGDFQALGAMRTLAKKGIPVILLDSDFCVGQFSRYATVFCRSPPLSKQQLYLQFLNNLVTRHDARGWVLIPNNDEAVFLVSKNKRELQRYLRISTPDWNIIQKVYIKKNTYLLAEAKGIPVPTTYYPRDLHELLALELHYPVIFKPSIRDHFYYRTKKKALFIPSREDLVKAYKYVCGIIDPDEVMIQEYMSGGARNLYSCCPFFKDGRIVTCVMAQRSRQHPMDFGHASTFVETVDIPELRELSERFLGSIDYYGLAEVEFMKDSKDGRFKLIEVNPRIWGWHTLAIAAGVDLLYLLYRDMVGEPFEVPERAKSAKWVHMTTDLPTVIKEIAKGKMKISDYLRSMKGKKEFALFSMTDPLPSIAEILMIPYLWAKRGF